MFSLKSWYLLGPKAKALYLPHNCFWETRWTLYLGIYRRWFPKLIVNINGTDDTGYFISLRSPSTRDSIAQNYATYTLSQFALRYGGGGYYQLFCCDSSPKEVYASHALTGYENKPKRATRKMSANNWLETILWVRPLWPRYRHIQRSILFRTNGIPTVSGNSFIMELRPSSLLAATSVALLRRQASASGVLYPLYYIEE